MKQPTHATWYAVTVNNHLTRIVQVNPGISLKEAIVMATIRARLDGFKPRPTK